MSEVHILAIDLAKRSFQVCATAPGGEVLFNRTVSRARLEKILRERRALWRWKHALQATIGGGSLKV